MLSLDDPKGHHQDKTMNNDVELTPVRDHHRFDEQRLWNYLKLWIDDDFSKAELLQFEGGQSNPTFLITAAHAQYVLRKKPPGKLLKSAHQVEREYKVMSALQDTHVKMPTAQGDFRDTHVYDARSPLLQDIQVPVPHTYLLCEDLDVIGTSFFVMEFVPGRVLLDTHLPALSPVERTAVYRSFIESIAALHKIDHVAVGLGDLGRPGNYYARQIHRWSEQYKASETDNISAMNSIMAWLPEHIPESPETGIVHGDFRLPNCIIHPSEPRIAAMLDWELCTIGHPLADIAYWCSMEYHGQKQFPAHHAELGLPSEQELLDYYCFLTGRDRIEDWTFYIAFNLFRSAAIRQGVYKRGLDGNASSERWRESGASARASAIKAWQLVQAAGLA